MKKADLITAAEDLNTVIGFDEPIDIGLNDGDLLYQIKLAALWLYESDKIKNKTVEVLKSIEWKEDDFADLKEDQNPLPAFIRYEIVPEPDPSPQPEEKKKKPVKPKAQKEKDPEPEDLGEEILKQEENQEEEEEPEPVEEEEEEEVMEHLDKAPPKKKPTKAEGASAYGTALAMMGPNPNLPLHELYEFMKAEGFSLQKSGGSIKTAHSIFRKCYRYLKMHGHIKEE